jgi:hypothetical protein
MSDSGQHESRHIGVTTVEPNDRRHLVTPYDDKALLKLGAGVVACTFCGHARFRRSRLRFNDLLELLMLRYPLRCMRCSQRQYNTVNVAMMSIPPRSANGRMTTDAPGSSWQSWTDPSTRGQFVARPLSTAQNPQAKRLEETTRTTRSADPGHAAALEPFAAVTPSQPVATLEPAVTAPQAQHSGTHTVPPPHIPSRRKDDGIW